MVRKIPTHSLLYQYIQMISKQIVLNGDCLDVLKTLPDNSIDAVVTDPPYGISFMGKKWDYDVPAVAVWHEVLRVLKPGGHALVACGTRTQHRMAVNLEDAGFEIRDIVMWVYGSGFPKSLNIGKAIYKEAGAVREVLGFDESKWRDHKNHVGETVGKDFKYYETKCQITAPTTPEAQQWEGWGTALKPSYEAWTLCKKPENIFQSSSVFEILFVSLCAQIKTELCQSQSFATTAEKIFKSSPKELNGVASIAQWIADESTNIRADFNVLTAILQSLTAENMCWSIVLSWLNILEEICEAMSIFTTETKISLTTDLKILKSLEWANIFQSITLPKKTSQSGLSASVCDAQSLFNVLQLKLKTTLTHIAQERAL